MSHVISDHGYVGSRPWSWRWFALGPTVTVLYVLLALVSWQLAGPVWVGGLVLGGPAVLTTWWAHHLGPGRMSAYLLSSALGVVVSYALFWMSALIYFTHTS
jgi:hypothetical protein